jgi:hypothetical protein
MSGSRRSGSHPWGYRFFLENSLDDTRTQTKDDDGSPGLASTAEIRVTRRLVVKRGELPAGNYPRLASVDLPGAIRRTWGEWS